MKKFLLLAGVILLVACGNVSAEEEQNFYLWSDTAPCVHLYSSIEDFRMQTKTYDYLLNGFSVPAQLISMQDDIAMISVDNTVYYFSSADIRRELLVKQGLVGFQRTTKENAIFQQFEYDQSTEFLLPKDTTVFIWGNFESKYLVQWEEKEGLIDASVVMTGGYEYRTRADMIPPNEVFSIGWKAIEDNYGASDLLNNYWFISLITEADTPESSMYILTVCPYNTLNQKLYQILIHAYSGEVLSCKYAEQTYG